MRQKRIFNDWLATFRPSINSYGYYTDFAKVYENAECMISGNLNQKDVEKMARETYGIEFVEGLRTRLYVVGDKIIKV